MFEVKLKSSTAQLVQPQSPTEAGGHLMAERFDTAAVLGAGVMGAGIAAHFAGAGIRTHLLDIVPPDLKGDELKDPRARNRFAENGIAGALKAKPAAFYDPDAARLIIPGNFDDHLDRLGECDLIVEAVVERMDIKKSLSGRRSKTAFGYALLQPRSVYAAARNRSRPEDRSGSGCPSGPNW
jgi:2-polyprenyl-6-methoxyphenol hydroxylase-like FAD-dependent oxidoreductase